MTPTPVHMPPKMYVSDMIPRDRPLQSIDERLAQFNKENTTDEQAKVYDIVERVMNNYR